MQNSINGRFYVISFCFVTVVVLISNYSAWALKERRELERMCVCMREIRKKEIKEWEGERERERERDSKAARDETRMYECEYREKIREWLIFKKKKMEKKESLCLFFCFSFASFFFILYT